MKFTHYHSICALSDSAHSLMQQQSHNNLYLSKLWFSTMISAGLETDAKVSIYAVESESDDCLALLLLRSPAGQNGSKFSKWVQSKHSLASLTNFQASFYAVLIDTEACGAVQIIETLVKKLSELKPAIHLIDLNLMSSHSVAYQTLHRQFKHSGFSSFPYVYKGNWFESFNFASFDEYLSARSKSNKKSIKNYQRKQRKLAREGRLVVKMFSSQEQVDEALAVYEKIYCSSWKQADLFDGFYPQLIKAAAVQGSLRFLCLYVDEQPVAFEFAIVTGTQCVMMRTAYIQSYQNESVGSIAILLMIQHVIEYDKITQIDFGTDDDRYKSTWVTERRERCGIISFNRYTPLGRFYWTLFTIDKIKESVKNKMKLILNSKVDS